MKPAFMTAPDALASKAEPVAWQDPETSDVITDERKREWATHYGRGGASKAATYTVPLGKIGSDGEQDDWDTEADSWARVTEFCRANPGKTIGLYPFPAAPTAQGESDEQ